MKYLGNNLVAKTVLAFMTLAIMSLGVLSIVTMNHKMGMGLNYGAISQSDTCPDSHGDQTCINYHLGIMHNLSEATHNNLGSGLILLSLFSFIGFLALSLFGILQYFFIHHRIRFRQLYEKTNMAFARQLGQWLTLFEKRDPIGALVLA